MKSVSVPSELVAAPFNHRSLQLNGFSAIESCTHADCTTGSMFLEEHMLLYVAKGQNIVTYGKQTFPVRENEMLLVKKASLIQYNKTGIPASGYVYESILFFLKDEFIQDFVRMADITAHHTEEDSQVMVKPIGERLQRFFESVMPYFNEPQQVDAGLLKIKMLELLYNIAATDKRLLQQFLQLKKPVKADLVEVMEANFSNQLSLEQLAYLSGRSLAAFKRDCMATLNMPPAEWIRVRRLQKAKEALENTGMPVLDVCYMVGFENPSHFSRIFKAHFGVSPTAIRQEAQA